jgi:membrane protease YdiL (CAAX protease family)
MVRDVASESGMEAGQGATGRPPGAVRAGFPWRFTLLTFGVSWGLWATIAASGGGIDDSLASGLAYVLGGFGPAIAGVVSIRRYDRAEREEFWHRLLRPDRVGTRWGAVILLLYPTVVLVSFLLTSLFVPGVGFPPSSDLLAESVPSILLTVLFVVVGPVSEEPGWRGYALDRLQERWTPLVASLLLGVVWWAWHLPLLAVPGSFLYGFASSPTFIAGYLGTVLLYSVLFTWVYNENRRSVLATVLMHFSVNMTTGILTPPFEVFAVTTGLLILVTGVVVVHARMWERPTA